MSIIVNSHKKSLPDDIALVAAQSAICSAAVTLLDDYSIHTTCLKALLGGASSLSSSLLIAPLAQKIFPESEELQIFTIIVGHCAFKKICQQKIKCPETRSWWITLFAQSILTAQTEGRGVVY